MSTVSASVTRRPSRNSVALPSRRHQLADLRAAAVDDDRAHADQRASARCPRRTAPSASWSDGAGERVAAVLDDHHLAGEATDVRQRLDQRRRLDTGASVRVVAVAVTGTARPAAGRRSRRGRARRWRPAPRRRTRPCARLSMRADRHDGAGALVVAGGDVDGVASRASPSSTASRRSRPRTARRPSARGARRAATSVEHVGAGGRAGVAGGQDAAVHRREVRA